MVGGTGSKNCCSGKSRTSQSSTVKGAVVNTNTQFPLGGAYCFHIHGHSAGKHHDRTCAGATQHLHLLDRETKHVFWGIDLLPCECFLANKGECHLWAFGGQLKLGHLRGRNVQLCFKEEGENVYFTHAEEHLQISHCTTMKACIVPSFKAQRRKGQSEFKWFPWKRMVNSGCGIFKDETTFERLQLKC